MLILINWFRFYAGIFLKVYLLCDRDMKHTVHLNDEEEGKIVQAVNHLVTCIGLIQINPVTSFPIVIPTQVQQKGLI